MAALAQVDLSRYERLFRRATGGDHPLILCARDGTQVRVAGAPVAGLEALTAPCFPRARDAQPRLRVNGATVLLAPVDAHADEAPVGWLATVAQSEDSVAEGRLEQALADVARCVWADVRLAADLDATARELNQRCEELNLVFGVAGGLREYEDADQFLDTTLGHCLDHLPIDAAVLFVDGDRHRVARADPASGFPELDLLLVGAGDELFRFLRASREPLVVNAPDDPRRGHLLAGLPCKLLAVPFTHSDKHAGTLLVLNRAERPDFTNSDRSLLGLIAQQASAVLRIEGMLGAMRSFNAQMAATLISAVEAKDPYTRGHSERVQRLSARIGETLGLSREDLEQLYWGSLLHDVGKIGIPDRVLNKPGSLTPDEFAFIRLHPERSFAILRHIEHLQPAALAARHHQEKYDGTGYPAGLRSESIPLLARIISVADVFDSMTSSRAYRPGLSFETALEEIRKVAGTQLDPRIAHAFLDLVRRPPECLDPLPAAGIHQHG